MRILLIYPDHLPAVAKYRGYFNQGVASIAASLLRDGHEVRIYHIISTPQQENYSAILRDFSPRIIAISSTTNQYSHAHVLAGWSKKLLPDALVVCGGVHATLNAEQVIAMPEFDMVCQGEGEIPMCHLANALSNGEDGLDTPGMLVRQNNRAVSRNPLPPLIQDLDEFPWPNRDLWNYPELQMESRGFATVMFSRGCPHRCTYCCNLAMSKIYREGGGRYFRIRSVDNAIREMKWIVEKYPFIKAFNFDDDNLYIDLEWAREFTDRYAAEISLPFTCNLFPKLIDEERVALLKRAGCVDLRIGLESGNEEIRRKMLGRSISDDDMRHAYRLCREAGIQTRSFVMVGIPGETPEKVLDTIKFVAEEKVGIAQCSIFYPFRGTELYNICIKEGYIREGNVNSDKDYFTGSVLNLREMPKGQILMFRSYFPILVILYRLMGTLPYSIRKPAARIIDRVVVSQYLPGLLNPFSGLLRVAKWLIPAWLKLNQVRLKQ